MRDLSQGFHAAFTAAPRVDCNKVDTGETGEKAIDQYCFSRPQG